MTAAVLELLAALDKEQHDAVSFAMDDPERQTWSNLPVFFTPREGLSFGEMSQAQIDLVEALLAASLSTGGARSALEIIAVDELAAQSGSTQLGSAYYHVGVFGDPQVDSSWGWQLDGHHLALNFTVVGDDVTMAPSLWGVQPMVSTHATRGEMVPLRDEVDRALDLISALDKEQLAVATLGTHLPPDLLAGPDYEGGLAIEGLPGSALSADQQGLLLSLIDAYIGDQADVFAALRRVEIEAELADTHLGWIGDMTEGGAFYYRIHGPNVLIEFDHVEGPDHIHSVVRDPANDYGLDWLKWHRAVAH